MSNGTAKHKTPKDTQYSKRKGNSSIRARDRRTNTQCERNSESLAQQMDRRKGGGRAGGAYEGPWGRSRPCSCRTAPCACAACGTWGRACRSPARTTGSLRRCPRGGCAGTGSRPWCSAPPRRSDTGASASCRTGADTHNCSKKCELPNRFRCLEHVHTHRLSCTDFAANVYIHQFALFADDA